ELMKLSKPLADLYTGLETDLIQNIAQYLAQQNTECSTAQWKIKALASLGRLDKSNIRTIAEYAGIVPDMLALALEQSALSAINEFEPGFKKLAEEGIIKNAAVPPKSSMANALKSFSRQAQEQLNLVNTVMKYKARSAAGKLIKNAAELADKQSFLDVLNKAAGKAVTGIESRQAAMRQCIKEMCDKGIPCFVDKRGREWSPEAYINMDIRTTCGNAAHQAQFDRMDDYGVDLIAISSHIGARPKCANDQGKIFNRKGKGGYTEDLNGNKIKYYAWSDSSYGEPDGILGINCGHHPYPFVPGISLQRYFPYEKEENDKAYKLSQAQRQLERNVRSRKRECTALDTLGDKEGFQKASVKLKREQDKIKRFCEDTGRTYRPDRTATPGFNKSISGKALKSAKSVDNNRDSGIIKSREVNFLEQAKKRDKKIYVTDVAIEKVGAVNLSDFSEHQIATMQAKHKELLKLAKTKNNSNEVLLIDDLEFKSEVSILGEEFGVAPAENPFAVSIIEKADKKSLIYMHNHPSTNNFSVSDIDTFICESSVKTLSVVTNQGEVYILNKLKQFDYNKTRAILKEIYDSFIDEEIDDKDFVSEFLKLCEKGGIEYAKSK
ncbi:MAG TPA: phage minor capsid protein, partial [Oscillospiraceae bacterium]|nr:phage minor capsid protein [Oscillospiraceae bacterium]